jgi:carbonic anhydrase
MPSGRIVWVNQGDPTSLSLGRRMPHPLQRLINGFERFRNATRTDETHLFEQLVAEGQAPQVLVVACSDSRVDPAILTSCKPGDLCVVRNVAALVPPYEGEGCHHSTGAALEFGVQTLGVANIVVLGHAFCGGVGALSGHRCIEHNQRSLLHNWVDIAAPALDAVTKHLRHASTEQRRRTLEQATVVHSLANLLTYPWLRERVQRGSLVLHGWYFDMAAADLLGYSGSSHQFVPVRDTSQPLSEEEPICMSGWECSSVFDVARFVEESSRLVLSSY